MLTATMHRPRTLAWAWWLILVLLLPATAGASGQELVGAEGDPAPGDEGADASEPAPKDTGQDPADEAPAPTPPSADESATELDPQAGAAPEAAPTPEPERSARAESPPHDLADSVVLLAVPGRAFAGLLVAEGEYIVTLLEPVRVGFPVRVGLADGSQTRARLVAREPEMGLALLRMDSPAAPEYAVRPSSRRVARGEEVVIIGHGGTSLVPAWLPELGAMVSFSRLTATVAAVGPEVEEEGPFPAFLVDRSPGEGDLGAPIFDAYGEMVGLLADLVEGGGGRAVAVSGAAVLALLAQPRLDQPKPRQSHFQSWGGFGLAVHNRPLHFAGAALVGVRIAIIDQIRLEPWFELDLGVREAVPGPVPSPQTFWWSLETGLNVGYRLNIFNPRSRDYVVPNVGFRVGWNRFDRWDESLVAECDGAECRWVEDSELLRVESVRPGIDLGLDVQKGPLRIGYRFFLAPGGVDAWSMHRIFITFDGFPLPMRFGDSH